MGNVTNDENWAARARLREIEARLWWRGYVGRKELMEHFGMSPAQVSSDIQKYLKINAGVVVYHTSRKRYETLPAMKPVMHEPTLEEGLRLALGEEVHGTQRPVEGMCDLAASPVSIVRMPRRAVDRDVQRFLLLAAAWGRKRTSTWKVKVRYISVSSGSSGDRELVPRGFGFDGRRWHVRAYCLKSKDWRDFVLGRFEKVSWPTQAEEVPEDDAWQQVETLTLTLNPELSEDQRKALRLDYGLQDDQLVLEVRQAMRDYVLSNLRLNPPGDGPKRPQHFLLGS